MTQRDITPISVALARCAMANNPNEAVKHQVTRLANVFMANGEIDISKSIEDLFIAATEEEKSQKLIQSIDEELPPFWKEFEEWDATTITMRYRTSIQDRYYYYLENVRSK